MSAHPHTILLIDTAQETAMAGCSSNGLLRHCIINTSQKEHATFLHPAIEELTQACSLSMGEWNAVAVVNGPGSYTGLRVGLSAAKGICYALNIPLICINTLEWMAFGNSPNQAELMCPMIDARRSEVFTAVYNHAMQVQRPAQAVVLEADSFSDLLDQHTIHFFGSGSEKWKAICRHPHANFHPAHHSYDHLATMAEQRFAIHAFNDLALTEPEYTKEFFSTSKKSI